MYSNRCRLCLDDEALDLFDGRLQGSQQLRSYVQLTTGIEIKETDKAPRKVCSGCCMLAIKLLKYRSTAALNDMFLKKQFGQILNTITLENLSEPAENTKVSLDKPNNLSSNQPSELLHKHSMVTLTSNQVLPTNNRHASVSSQTNWNPTVWLERQDIEKMMREHRKKKEVQIVSSFNTINENEVVEALSADNVLKLNGVTIKKMQFYNANSESLTNKSNDSVTVKDTPQSCKSRTVAENVLENMLDRHIKVKSKTVQHPFGGNSTIQDQTMQNASLEQNMQFHGVKSESLRDKSNDSGTAKDTTQSCKGRTVTENVLDNMLDSHIKIKSKTVQHRSGGNSTIQDQTMQNASLEQNMQFLGVKSESLRDKSNDNGTVKDTTQSCKGRTVTENVLETLHNASLGSSKAFQSKSYEIEDRNPRTHNSKHLEKAIERNSTPKQLNRYLSRTKIKKAKRVAKSNLNVEDDEIIPAKKVRTFKYSQKFRKADLTTDLPLNEEMVKQIFTSSLELTPNTEIQSDSSKFSNLLSPSGKSESIFVCNLCQTIFSTKKNLQMHKQTHLKCKFCKTRLKSLEILNDHMKQSCLVLERNMPILCLPRVNSISSVVEKYPDAFEETVLSDDDVIIIEDDIEIDETNNSTDTVFCKIPNAEMNETKPACTTPQQITENMADLLSSDSTEKIESVSVVHPFVNCLNSQIMPNILFRDNIMQILFSKHTKLEDKSTNCCRPLMDSIEMADEKIYFKNLFKDLVLWRAPVHFSNHPTTLAEYTKPKSKPANRRFLRWLDFTPKGLIRKTIHPFMTQTYPSPEYPSATESTSTKRSVQKSKIKGIAVPQAHLPVTLVQTANPTGNHLVNYCNLNPNISSYASTSQNSPVHPQIVQMTNIQQNVQHIYFGNNSPNDRQMNILASNIAIPQSVENTPVSTNPLPSAIRVRSLSELTKNCK